MFVDTHCHLAMLPQDAVVQAANMHVEHIVTVGITLPDSINAIALARKFPGVWATVGIHPCDCSELWAGEFEEIKKLCADKKNNKIVALGETGLDFYHKPFFKQRQIDAFTAHIECALEHDLPVVVHIRESVDEVLKVLENYKNNLSGVAHCFSQQKDAAKILISWGFYLGIGGPISYPKNDQLRDIVKDIDLKYILLETDAPFLPPQEFRGKKNHPKYIPLIANVIADLKDVEARVIGDVTTANAKRLFGINN